MVGVLCDTIGWLAANVTKTWMLIGGGGAEGGGGGRRGAGGILDTPLSTINILHENFIADDI